MEIRDPVLYAEIIAALRREAELSGVAMTEADFEFDAGYLTLYAKSGWIRSVVSTVDRHRPLIPIEECVVGHLYRGSGRNIGISVYLGDGEFIGVRQKFSFIYLDNEYYHGPKTGTYRPRFDAGPLTPAAWSMFERRAALSREHTEAYAVMREADKRDNPTDWNSDEVQDARADRPDHKRVATVAKDASKLQSYMIGWFTRQALKQSQLA